jgi:site-specific recombinase XerC
MVRPASAIHDIPYADIGPLGDYLLDCRDTGLRPRTIIEKWTRVRAVEAYLGRTLVDATEADVRRSLAYLKITNSTRATYLSHVRSYTAWLTSEDHRVDDPTRRIKTPKRPRRVPRDVDPNQVIRISGRLEVDGPARWAVDLMLWCGVRCAEAAGIDPHRDLIDRPDGTVLRVTGKGGHERVVDVPDDLADRLRARPPGWLFPRRGTDGEEHVAPERIGCLVAEALRSGGLDATAHQLRHTNATHLLDATGGDVVAVQEHLGHASLTSTQIYVRSTGGRVAAAAPRLYRGRRAKQRARRTGRNPVDHGSDLHEQPPGHRD